MYAVLQIISFFTLCLSNSCDEQFERAEYEDVHLDQPFRIAPAAHAVRQARVPAAAAAAAPCLPTVLTPTTPHAQHHYTCIYYIPTPPFNIVIAKLSVFDHCTAFQSQISFPVCYILLWILAAIFMCSMSRDLHTERKYMHVRINVKENT